jgi:HEAT repeat protein
VEKKCFERSGNFLRFGHEMEGSVRKFEFYHEPFEGSLADNVELFAAMYESGVPGRMQQGVNLLAQSKDKRAIPTLVKAVKDNKFTGRTIAAAGLANFPGSRKAMKALTGTFTTGDFMLTITAINALGKLGMPSARRQVRKVLARCLRREELFTAEPTAGPAAVLALACISTLIELGDDEHRPLLLRFLAHPAWEVRSHAARVYAKFPDKNAEVLLRRLFDEANPFVRINAAEALIKLGDQAPYGALVELGANPDAAVRAATLVAVASLATDRAYDIMERFLGSERDLGLRLDMVARLRAAGRHVGLDELREGLGHESPFVRQTAIKVASNLGGENEMALLKEAAADEPDEFLREQLQRELGAP